MAWVIRRKRFPYHSNGFISSALWLARFLSVRPMAARVL
jgi:hypothetical protein